jgi:SAM-dependent methyltransferase
MVTDAHAAADFYATPTGAVAAHLLRRRLMALWPGLDGQAVLGLGYPAPYLRLWRDHAARTIALTPAQIGAARWPPGVASLACTAEETALPFADLSFDRVLLVHGLEAAESARGLLREVWRVLKDDGHLLVVAPNRTGLWAHLESTPFGQGQPYSWGQIERLLTSALFRVERRDSALYMPPSRRRLLLRGAGVWEGIGRAIAPRLAGVTITEASKDLYAAVPSGARKLRRLVFAEAR